MKLRSPSFGPPVSSLPASARGQTLRNRSRLLTVMLLLHTRALAANFQTTPAGGRLNHIAGA
jgi:hypothetical protein